MTAYEPSDLPAGGAAAAIGGLFALVFVAGAVVALLLGGVSSGEAPPAHAAVARPPPPRLEVTPRADRLRLERQAKARLRGDAAQPSIDAAMRQVAREGWRDGAAGEAP